MRKLRREKGAPVHDFEAFAKWRYPNLVIAYRRRWHGAAARRAARWQAQFLLDCYKRGFDRLPPGDRDPYGERADEYLDIWRRWMAQKFKRQLKPHAWPRAARELRVIAYARARHRVPGQNARERHTGYGS
ncbi:MAG TPA: hypothetical protein VF203_07730 [Burkholderiales bacterium]